MPAPDIPAGNAGVAGAALAQRRGRYYSPTFRCCTRTAGAFDVRVVIAGLLGFYGIVLVILGLTADSAEQREKTGDVNANLWAGVAMAVVAASFVLWARLRPVSIDPPASTEKPNHSHPGNGEYQ